MHPLGNQLPEHRRKTSLNKPKVEQEWRKGQLLGTSQHNIQNLLYPKKKNIELTKEKI